MNSKFTQDDLVLFIYNELDASMVPALTEELQNNPILRAEYNNLLETAGKLSAEFCDPDDTSVHIVMDYSGSYHSAPEHHTD